MLGSLPKFMFVNIDVNSSVCMLILRLEIISLSPNMMNPLSEYTLCIMFINGEASANQIC